MTMWLSGSVAAAGIVCLLACLFLAVSSNTLSLTAPLNPATVFLLVEFGAVWPPLVIYSTDPTFPMSTAFEAASLAALCFIVGYLLTGGSTGSFRARRVDDPPVLPGLRIVVIGTVLMLVLIQLFENRGVPPYLSALRSMFDPSDTQATAVLRETRRELTKSHLSGAEYRGQGAFRIVSEVAWQLIVGTVVACRSLGRPLFNPPGEIAVAVLAFLGLAATGVRSTVLSVVVVAALALMLTKQVSPRLLVASGVLVLGALMLISPLSKGSRAGGESLTDRALAVAERVSTGNGRHNAEIIALMDEGTLPRQGGTVFVEKTVAMVPGVQAPNSQPFAQRLTRLIYNVGDTNTSYSTSTQLGILIADWGLPGVALGYLAAGIVLSLTWTALTQRASAATGQNAAPLVALLAIVLYQTTQYAIGGIHAFFVPMVLALCLERAWMVAIDLLKDPNQQSVVPNKRPEVVRA